MADFNDVVRHVILRISVDQAGLAGQLSAAREKLKDLKDKEKPINAERVKSAEAVTKAYEAQNKAIDDNRAAHEGSQKAAGDSRKAADGVKEHTAAITADTKATNERAVAEAKAAAIESKTRQDELNSIAERSKRKKAAVAQEKADALALDALEKKLASDQLARDAKVAAEKAKAANQRLGGQTTRANRSNESAARVAGTELKNTDAKTLLEGSVADRLKAARDQAAAESEIAKARAEKAKADAAAAATRAANAAEAAKRAADREADRLKDKADREAKAAQREVDQANARAAREAKAAQREIDQADAKAAREAKAAQREIEQQAAKEARAEKAAARDQAREEKAAERDAARIASKEERDQRAAAREEERARAKQQREDKAAERDANREQKRLEREAAAAQRSIDIAHSAAVVEDRRRTAKAAADNEAFEKAHRAALAEDTRRGERAARELRAAEARAQQEINLAERIAAREAALIERNKQRYFKRGGFGAAGARLLGDVSTVAARTVVDAPRALVGRREATTTTDDGSAIKDIASAARGAEGATRRFFNIFRAGAKDAEHAAGSLGARFKSFIEDINRPRAGGSGGNLFGDIAGNFTRLQDLIGKATSGIGRHLFSMGTLVVAVIAAFGPLAAILGAVGAAALGLASNLGALAGSLGALPGLISAAVGAFGVLALVIKPLSGVFSAFGAAQEAAGKGSAAGSKAASDAADRLESTQRRLNNARKQASRDIEDYRLALRKLRYDEEGSRLGVESAEQEYRRALADPTKSSLDRRVARHNVEGARFDQEEQNLQTARTQQDAAEAFKKGVEGADAVADALRDLAEAQKDAAAGGTANRAAQEKLEAELNKLGPKTRTVVEAVLGLDGAFKSFQKRLSDRIFGQITGDTDKFAGVLESLEAFLNPTADAFGSLAHQALVLFTNPEWKKFFSSQGKENGKVIQTLGEGALAAAEGFKGLIVAARPLVRFLTDGFKGAAESFAKFTNSADGQEKLGNFFKLTVKRMGEMKTILGNLFTGFVGFFSALNSKGPKGEKDFTSFLNDGLIKATARFAELGKIAADPNSGFRKWLEQVKPLLADIGGLIKAVGVFFGNLFSDQDNIDEARDTLQQISTRWLPALADIFDKLSQSGVISKLATGISNMLEGLDKFLSSGGISALSAVGDVLKATGVVFDFIAGVVSYLVENIPYLGTLLGVLAAGLILFLGAAVIAKFSGAMAAAKLLYSAILGVKNLINSIRGRKIKFDVEVDGLDDDDNPRSKNKPNPTKPGGGTGSKPSPGVPSTGGVSGSLNSHLTQIKALLRQIAVNTGGLGSADFPDGDDDKDKSKNKPGKGGKGGKPNRGGKGGLGGVIAEGAEEAAEAGAASSGGILSKIKNFFTKGGGGAAAGGAASEAGSFTAGKLGSILRGGLIAAGLTIAATTIGGKLTDTLVKDDEDKNSLNGAINTTASYAGTGALLGNILFPGVGGVVGGVAGGVAGAAKSVFTDKNLQSFLNDKIPGSLGPLAGTFGLGGDKKLTQDQKSNGILGGVTGALSSAGGAVSGAASAAGGALSNAGGAIKDFFGNAGDKVTDVGGSILKSLGKAKDGVGDFFTKTIPNLFTRGVAGIGKFFTQTLPGLPKRAIEGIAAGFGFMVGFFTIRLPRIVGNFFHDTLPKAAATAWRFVKNNLWDPFQEFVTVKIPNFFTETIPTWFSSAKDWFTNSVIDPVKHFITESIPNFFTETIPTWFSSAKDWFVNSVFDPLKNFITVDIPNFFTETIPNWFATVPQWISANIVDPLKNFFTVDIPNFFTVDIPNAIRMIPGFVMDVLVKPVTEFFGGVWNKIKEGAGAVWDWAKGLFSNASDAYDAGKAAGAGGMMSGGLVSGVYQGIEDTAVRRLTPGEFVVRRSKMQDPGAKAVLTDWNEGRLDLSGLYSGLAASSAPQVMSMVPPDAVGMTGAVPTVVNNTVHQAPIMGDVTIHNPVRERSEHSLRRQVQIAAIRHRR